jgi:hypothetical protein
MWLKTVVQKCEERAGGAGGLEKNRLGQTRWVVVRVSRFSGSTPPPIGR